MRRFVAVLDRITTEERRARLAVRHHLAPSHRIDDVATVADHLVGLHSSDPVTVYLSAAARVRRPSLEAVSEALYEQRSVVRFHGVRRTLWVASIDLAADAHASSTERYVARERTRFTDMMRRLEIVPDPERWLDDAEREMLAYVSANGEVTTREIGDALPHLRQTMEVPSGSGTVRITAHSRVALLLGFAGRIVRSHPTGSWISSEYRWAETTAWLGREIRGRDSRAAASGLAERWLRAFGPASRDDLRWWTGWTVRDTVRALDDVDAVAVDMDGVEGWVLPDDLDSTGDPSPWVALLPALDSTTMGWKDRSFFLDPGHAERLFDGNGNAGPTVWVDGRIVGGWAQRDDGTIAIGLLEPVGSEARAAIDERAHALESLLGDTRFKARFKTPHYRELMA